MKRIYFDNSIVKDFARTPELWDSFYDEFIEHFGRTFHPIESYYLFFEYIGFHKDRLKIPSALVNCIKFEPLLKKDITPDDIHSMDTVLDNTVNSIEQHIESKLFALESFIKGLVEEASQRVSSFIGAQKLHEKLFGRISTLVAEDFPRFVKEAKLYLIWDVFCTITPEGISVKNLRERQLGYWMTFWEGGYTYPFGKIIDDHSEYYEISFSNKSLFKNYEDMVDAEMLTYVVLGIPTEDGTIDRCYCLTYDSHTQTSERIRLALGSVNNIEQTLEKTLKKVTGKTYRLKKNGHKIMIDYINEPLFVIPLK
jgi:hypothetical protein